MQKVYINKLYIFKKQFKLKFLNIAFSWTVVYDLVAQYDNEAIFIAECTILGFIHITFIVALMVLNIKRQQFELLAYLLTLYIGLLKPILMVPSAILFGQMIINHSFEYAIVGIVLYFVLTINCTIATFWFRNSDFPNRNSLKQTLNIAHVFSLPLELMALLIYQFQLTVIRVLFLICYLIINCVMMIDGLLLRTQYCPHNKILASFSGSLILFNILALLYQVNFIFEDQFFYFATICSPLLIQMIEHIYDKLTIYTNLGHKQELIYQSQLNPIEFMIEYASHLQICKQDSCRQTDEEMRVLAKRILLCNYKTFLDEAKRQKKNQSNELETIYLQYISFLANDVFVPLLAYIQMKKFQQQFASNRTNYFQIQCGLKVQQLEKACQQFQQIKFKHQIRNELEMEKFSIKEIRDSVDLTELMVPKIIQTVQNRQEYYAKMVLGFPIIEEAQKLLIKHASLIEEIRLQLNNRLGINDEMKLEGYLKGLNGLQLRLLSMFRALVLNDYLQTRMVEAHIEELLSYQKTLNIEIVMDLSMINEQMVLIIISVIENRGLILNKNRSEISKFFGFKDNSMLTHINQVMPKFISRLHNKFLEDYIQRGFSPFFTVAQEVFFENEEGFISSAKLKLENIFDSRNDYAISGTLLKKMSEQEYIMFDKSGKLLGISCKIYEELFSAVARKELILQCYVQLLLQNFIESFNQAKEDMCRQENNFTVIDQKSLAVVPTNFEELVKQYEIFRAQNLEIDHNKRLQKSKASLYQEANTLSINLVMHQQSIKQDDGPFNMNGQRIDLLVEEEMEILQQFMNNKNEYSRTHTIGLSRSVYNLNYQLQYMQAGHGEIQIPYFIMKISEYKKVDPNRTQYLSTEYQTMFQKSEKAKSFVAEGIAISVISSNSAMPPSSFNNSSNNEVIKINDSIAMKWRQEEGEPDQHFYNRPGFNDPVYQAKHDDQDDFGQIEEDFRQLGVQNPQIIHSPRNENQPIRIDYNDNYIEEEHDDAQKSSTPQPNMQSRDLVNRMKEVQEGPLDDYKAKRSSSTVTSQRTSLSVFFLIRSLQHSNKIPKSLKVLYLQNTILLTVIAVICIIQIVTIKS